MSNDKRSTDQIESKDVEKRSPGSFFPEFTGLTALRVLPAVFRTVLCPACTEGARNITHMVKDPDGTEWTCPGLSFASPKGSPGEAIKPRIGLVRDLPPAYPKHGQSTPFLGNHWGGLIRHHGANTVAVDVHMLDSACDSRAEARPWMTAELIRNRDGLVGPVALYMYREPLMSGITTTYESQRVIDPRFEVRHPPSVDGSANHTLGGEKVSVHSAPADKKKTAVPVVQDNMVSGDPAPRRPQPVESKVWVAEEPPKVIIEQATPGAQVARRPNDVVKMTPKSGRPLLDLSKMWRAIDDCVVKVPERIGYSFDTVIEALIRPEGKLLSLEEMLGAGQAMDQAFDTFSAVDMGDAGARTLVVLGCFNMENQLARRYVGHARALTYLLPSIALTIILDDLLRVERKEREARLNSYMAVHPEVKELRQRAYLKAFIKQSGTVAFATWSRDVKNEIEQALSKNRVSTSDPKVELTPREEGRDGLPVKTDRQRALEDEIANGELDQKGIEVATREEDSAATAPNAQEAAEALAEEAEAAEADALYNR